MFVIDSNIFAKLFVDEHDSVEARAFFKTSIENEYALFAPKLFKYEVAQIAIYYTYPIEKALEKVARYCEYNLKLIEPEMSHWRKANEIANHGHENSGFPSLYDSIYHALAVENDSTFITADKRHYAKAETFGHIILLKDWHIDQTYT